MKKAIRLLILISALCAFVNAESKTEYAPNVVAGHGKNGFAWGQWTQTVKEAPVKEVRMRLQRIKGGDNAYVNLRFGRKGQALDGGKRVYLKDGKEVVVTWNVGGTSPGGQPLILNAYNCEVKVMKVAVIHK